MKTNLYHLVLTPLIFTFLFSRCSSLDTPEREQADAIEEHEKYDGPLERGLLETEKTRDPRLGYVPVERLWYALEYTEQLKQANNYRTLDLVWTERGPNFDSVGPSNGNRRGAAGTVSYTSGRVKAVLIDQSDPTGNTVFAGGVAGGIWKCTNFLESVPNWKNISEHLDNLAIASICQDPGNPDILYAATGEATSNADAVFGRGVYKSTNHGLTWSGLTATLGFRRNFKILCGPNGDVYLATRGFGLRRSSNGGASWKNITPTGLTTTSPSFCTDIEFSSTGKLHASFGYSSGSVNYRYTSTPSTVSSGTWNEGTGIRQNTTVKANRLEIAALADTLYAVTTNTSNNVDSCYMSIDGGATWSIRNRTAFPTGITNTQGWYDLTLAINPDNSSQIIVAGLDAYKSRDSGRTVQRNTFWVSTSPYVHADHQWIQWFKVGSENRVVMGTDGGIFLSRDSGRTYRDKNRNLAIKQFYSVAVHPTNPNYFIAGAQDNGTHQLKYPGLGSSIEVTGGDGMFVHINQKNPNIQFATYVYNQFRRSTNGGSTWSGINLSGTGGPGMFVNPFTYDDNANVLYASWSTSPARDSILRWNNPSTATNAATSLRDTIAVTSLMRGTTHGNASAFACSPYTPNRLFVGGSNGGLVRIDDANTVTNATIDAKTTVLTSNDFPGGFLNCINIGTSDDYLLAVFTNYGINNVWYSRDGGSSWLAIDGNLPDMPVRWAMFHPGDNSKVLLATEAGVYTTALVNGAFTVWMPSPGFPPVRTDMLKLRASDNIVAAATHGRGIFTGVISSLLPLRNISLSGTAGPGGVSLLNWKATDASTKAHYRIQYSSDGIGFTEIADLTATNFHYRHKLTASVGYYRIMGTEPNQAPVFSNTVVIRSTSVVKGLQVRILPNPVNSAGSFVVSSSEAGAYAFTLMDLHGRLLQTGSGVLVQGGSESVQLKVSTFSAGMYKLRVIQNKQVITSSILKQ